MSQKRGSDSGLHVSRWMTTRAGSQLTTGMIPSKKSLSAGMSADSDFLFSVSMVVPAISVFVSVNPMFVLGPMLTTLIWTGNSENGQIQCQHF